MARLNMRPQSRLLCVVSAAASSSREVSCSRRTGSAATSGPHGCGLLRRLRRAHLYGLRIVAAGFRPGRLPPRGAGAARGGTPDVRAPPARRPRGLPEPPEPPDAGPARRRAPQASGLLACDHAGRQLRPSSSSPVTVAAAGVEARSSASSVSPFRAWPDARRAPSPRGKAPPRPSDAIRRP